MEDNNLFLNLLISEFLWGIIIGGVLTYLGTYIAFTLQKREKSELVKNFCKDSISIIFDYIKSMDEHRDRSKVIYTDFIDLIDVEINIYGRNREHIILIADKETRKKIRELFSNTSICIANIRQSLNLYNEAYRTMSNVESFHVDYSKYKENVTYFLNEAHKYADRLVKLKSDNSNLAEEIK